MVSAAIKLTAGERDNPAIVPSMMKIVMEINKKISGRWCWKIMRKNVRNCDGIFFKKIVLEIDKKI